MLKDEQLSVGGLLPPLKKLRIAKASSTGVSGNEEGEPGSLMIEKLLSSIREDAEHIAQLQTPHSEGTTKRSRQPVEPLQIRMDRIEQGFCASTPEPIGKAMRIRGPSSVPAGDAWHEDLSSRQDRLSAGFCAPASHACHLEVQ